MIVTAETLRSLYRDTGPLSKRTSRKSRVVGIKTRKNFKRLSFLVKSDMPYSSPKGHISSIMYPNVDFRNISDDLGSPLSEDVKVICSCPSFTYWGSAYLATTEEYIIPPYLENRPADVRDPEGENFICKHLIKVIQYVGKKSFKQLSKRFTSGSLKTASIDEVKFALSDYLRDIHHLNNESVDEFLFRIEDEDSLEDVLEEVFNNFFIEI